LKTYNLEKYNLSAATPNQIGAHRRKQQGTKMESKRQWMATNRPKTIKLFRNLFPGNDRLVETISNHMREHGYDQSQPIILWDRSKEEGRNALYVVDGHTRLVAAKQVGLSSVYVARMKFPDEEAALQYAIHNQRDRRNITDADILRCIEAVDKLKSRGGDRKSESAKSKTSSEAIDSGTSSAAQTAKIVGTSKTKVEKARAVMKRADEGTKNDVRAGKKTIHKAYKETQQKRKPKAKPNATIESEAMALAELAIMRLEEINQDDPERKKAIETVYAWCRGWTRKDLYNDLKRSFRDAPDEEGWWWVEVERDGNFKKGKFVIVYVCENDDLKEDPAPFIPVDKNSTVLNIKGKWRGPINPPIRDVDISPACFVENVV
jgi:ParB family chromosome partitioning protein